MAKLHRFILGLRLLERCPHHRSSGLSTIRECMGCRNYGLERIFKVVLDLGVVLFLHRFAQRPMYVFGLCGFLSWIISGVAGIAGGDNLQVLR